MERIVRLSAAIWFCEQQQQQQKKQHEDGDDNGGVEIDNGHHNWKQ